MMVKLWARAGVTFEIDEAKLDEAARLIHNGEECAGKDIIKDAMLKTYAFDGESYIPDDNECAGGKQEIRGIELLI